MTGPAAVDLGGKVVAITGGSTGFGRGIAVLLARHGARVVVGDLVETAAPGNFDEAPDLTTVQLIESFGGEAAFQRSDVTRAGDLTALVALAVERFGRLDLMVNNAGVWRGGKRMHELTEADLDACLDVILKGTWFGAQAAVRVFLEQGGGAILNVVSTAGLRAHGNQSAYNVAKGAQAMLTRCLALEYGPSNIRVNGVCPTFMKTAMSRGGYESPGFKEAAKQRVSRGRWGEVKDVADLALFLASDASDFVHGALIPLDGGETLAGGYSL